MAKQATTKKVAKRKTFRQQGVEAWEKWAAQHGHASFDGTRRDAFLLGFKKGVKAHQTQRDTDGRPSERECKEAANALLRAAGILDGFEESEWYEHADRMRKLAAALRGKR